MNKISLILVLSLAGCGQVDDARTEHETPQDSYRCQSFGGFSEDVCMAALFRIAAKPHSYERKLVGVNGYVQIVDGDYFLFASREYFQASDFSASLICSAGAKDSCSRLASSVGHDVTLIGRFSDDVAIGDWVIRPVGSVEVERVIRR